MGKLTQDEIKSLFDYKNGKLVWKIKPNRNIRIGDAAGSIDSHGYLQTKHNGIVYLNHRLIWLMHYGWLPRLIDHVNGNKTDNRIENLRQATPQQNQHNAKRRVDNKSGVKGVIWHKDSRKWRADIQVNGKRRSLGCFDSIENAKEFIMLAREMLHENFANNGET